MAAERVEFEGSSGQMLAGRMELPPYKPRVFALFAHCFTCSKDIAAATRVARALSKKGVGVLRFDFTGIGNSEGDFANTDFTSNIQDLVAAGRFLEKHYGVPTVMIGHSLGGAAVLAAAAEIESVKAVVTIGAPSSPEHIKHLFSDHLSDIKTHGQVEIKLGGKPFQVSSKFVEDLDDHKLEEKVSKLDKALLIMHSPQDELVSVEHARVIYEAARHPKSFVTLDGADHLLSDPQDSIYAAHVISAWVERYLPEPLRDDPLANRGGLEPGQIAVVSRTSQSLTQDVLSQDHWILADEPENMTGQNRGMTPYDLLLASLGSCTSMTLQMYARRKKWDLQRVRVELKHTRTHAQDSESADQGSGRKIESIHRTIHLDGELSSEQKKRLLEIADLCPVHKTLHSHLEVVTQLKD